MLNHWLNLRPAIPAHITTQARIYRGERWFVLEDKNSGRFHRLNEVAYQLIARMNGARTVSEIIQDLNTQPDAPQNLPLRETDVESVLRYLYVSDLLICDRLPSTQEMASRQKTGRKQKWVRWLVNPVSWKFSLGNPSAFLDRLLPVANGLRHPAMAVIWMVVVGLALLQAMLQWPRLASANPAQLFTPGNMFLLWLTYPLLKAVHELGHALFTRAWGGAVTEWGVLFVMGTPLPYVDASAATGFANKSRRMMVSAAGMAVELFIAAIALMLWLRIEDGLFRSILFNLVVLGSVSTLLFNGNPLLKFDGYHLLCDLIETPNLASRANKQIQYLVRRYIYGVRTAQGPAATPLAGMGLSAYAVGAFVYKIFVLALIVFCAAQISLDLGILLGGWLMVTQAAWPALRYIIRLRKDTTLGAQKRRAFTALSVSVVALLVVVFVVPIPLATRAEGVVWLPPDSQVRGGSSGEVTAVLARHGEVVQRDQPLLQLRNLRLESELQLKSAKLAEVKARFEEVWSSDRTQAAFLEEEIRNLEGEVRFLQNKVEQLLVRSPSAGTVGFTQSYELLGSYVHQGQVVGYVTGPEPLTVRVAVTQEEIGLVREDILKVEARLARRLGTTYHGTVANEVPGGTFSLPSAALSVAGGGRLALSKETGEEQKTDRRIFLLDVRLPECRLADAFGERVYVRFQHSPEPLAQQVYRSLRQLFSSALLY